MVEDPLQTVGGPGGQGLRHVYPQSSKKNRYQAWRSEGCGEEFRGSGTPDLSSGAQQLCRKPAGVPDIVKEMSARHPGRDARRSSTLLEASRSARRINSARGEGRSCHTYSAGAACTTLQE
ncbi:Hypothetical predicted protein [Pelobates cultripes]|uniref:Uncharacterized protein n=1 Tax=Pelobates cultripes TaxID=61616 RepID=A0AAD1RSD0_PELCU|nr:Hypothetical predicted protein [Pelobates cultripes]